MPTDDMMNLCHDDIFFYLLFIIKSVDTKETFVCLWYIISVFLHILTYIVYENN